MNSVSQADRLQVLHAFDEAVCEDRDMSIVAYLGDKIVFWKSYPQAAQ